MRSGESRGSTIVRALITQCIQRPELRDELYCQLVRMVTDSTAPEEQLCRLWTLLCLCVVSFSPSRTLRKVFKGLESRVDDDDDNDEIAYFNVC